MYTEFYNIDELKNGKVLSKASNKKDIVSAIDDIIKKFEEVNVSIRKRTYNNGKTCICVYVYDKSLKRFTMYAGFNYTNDME